MRTEIRLGKRIIGHGRPTFIIAEAGVNHNGDIRLAKKLIDVAVAAGADSVKFQTFKAEESVTADAPLAAYQKRNDKTAKSFVGMLKRLELPDGAFNELAAYSRKRGILFFSKPAYVGAVDVLEEAGVPLYKIGSGDIDFISLLEKAARTGKPVILSTGMATIPEIEAALKALASAGCRETAVLHCVTSYPVEFRYANLKAIETLRRRFRVPIGYSDHTTGIEAAVASVALGACIVEKHFTLDRTMPGPDHKASLEPAELKSMVEQIRHVEQALGDGRKGPMACEKGNKKVVRKSLVALAPIGAGEVIRDEMIGYKRPGTGLPEKFKHLFVGKRARRAIAKDQRLKRGMAR